MDGFHAKSRQWGGLDGSKSDTNEKTEEKVTISMREPPEAVFIGS